MSLTTCLPAEAEVFSVPGSQSVGIKQCTCCRRYKLRSDFFADRRKSDGRRSDCKTCNTEQTRYQYHQRKRRQGEVSYPTKGRPLSFCELQEVIQRHDNQRHHYR
jgi:hypothetical protein